MTAPLLGQGKRVWVLRASGEMVEYDPVSFAAKGTVKLPAEAGAAPQSVSVNRLGQILFAPAVTLPLTEDEVKDAQKAWFWNGHTASALDAVAKRDMGATGSNQSVTELAAVPALSADGAHLFWFANSARRLQREEMDLSTSTTWQVWQTDLSGAGREDLASMKLPDCRCPSGSCEESCPYGIVWTPDGGVEKFFLVTEFVTGKDEPVYKQSTLYQEDGGKWTASVRAEPLRRVLDAASGGDVVVEAIPDTGCCGWVNQSNDQKLLHRAGKTMTVFDERATYKNPDYDVSFSTSNAKLSPDVGVIAMTIVSTAKAEKAIQLAQEGQANPEESRQIRKGVAELPAVEVKSMDDAAKRVAFVPHAVLVGWISEKEILIVEDHVLVGYNVATGTRRKSGVRVEDAGRVFLR
jgi:hypothetical protein